MQQKQKRNKPASGEAGKGRADRCGPACPPVFSTCLAPGGRGQGSVTRGLLGVPRGAVAGHLPHRRRRNGQPLALNGLLLFLPLAVLAPLPPNVFLLVSPLGSGPWEVSLLAVLRLGIVQIPLGRTF